MELPSFSIIFASIIFSMIGVCGIKIGKNQGEMRRVGIGAVLLTYTYFFENALLVWGIGLALTAALIWWKE